MLGNETEGGVFVGHCLEKLREWSAPAKDVFVLGMISAPSQELCRAVELSRQEMSRFIISRWAESQALPRFPDAAAEDESLAQGPFHRCDCETRSYLSFASSIVLSHLKSYCG